MDEATNALDYKNEKEIIDEVINLEKYDNFNYSS